ncbi:MAG: sigma-54-dependent Fis family transcriptional regulator [Spirochaetales bacterium]|jgi:DNA-binding NtrC family response regulator|nr:sigma-54-dependent Fis family transcriptional regulator [Spirochaetales bacterium]
MATLLEIESDKETADRVDHFFSGNGHQVSSVSNLDEADTALQENVFDVIICDVLPENRSFLDLLALKSEHNPSSILIVTYDLANIDAAVQAIREGAFDLIQRPFRIAELYIKVEKAIEIKRLQREAQNLRGERKLIYRTGDYIAHSPKIREVLRIVEKVARTDSSVIITGETGTGKELIAGTLHYNSERSDRAFVKVSCAALPDALLESELFGHEKGAFTGAERLRVGRFEQADGGSILLDEIGDVSLLTQVKILRVLQERELERLGSNRTIRVDIRFIAATNRNLEQMIEDGDFRKDLYYRLNVVTIRIPPLRERRQDILPLASFFLRKYSGDINKTIEDFDPAAARLLMDYDWPGNIRELENSIERAVIMTESSTITRADLHLTKHMKVNGSLDLSGGFPEQGINLEQVEHQLIIKALENSDWIQKDAAALLQLTPRALNYKIKKHNITHNSWKTHT